MALAQLAHLLGADAEEGEHAALRGDETEITLRAVLPQLLQHLVAQGLTLLIVTHEVEPLADVLTRVVLVENGRIARESRPGGAR